MSAAPSKIMYTWTDEAPMLATCSLLPILRAFARPANIEFELKDISLSGRILCVFPDRLRPDQQVPDALAELGALAKTPEANIVKLPNISASIPQLKAAILELQQQGYPVPDYPDEANSAEAKQIRARYASVLGSAVNPVLREGNSDRRVARPVKEYAQAHPHRMGEWRADSRTDVASMSEGDFFGSEQSFIQDQPGVIRIELQTAEGVQVLREGIALQAGEIFDGSVMRAASLTAFYADCVRRAREEDLLFSLHLKATMMKISDPILFGHALRVYFADFLRKHADLLAQIGFDPDNGLGDLEKRLQTQPESVREAVLADLRAALAAGPAMAMVDSDRGITNLHVPSDVIVDASMPAAIREGGKMWGPDGKAREMLAVIPDRSYAGVYREVIAFCKKNGAFDVRRMGSVANVGLMAQKAEEYGSHDKTFEIAAAGEVRVVDGEGRVRLRHAVEAGDIWRGCQTRHAAIADWVKLAVRRARATGAPAVFWLNPARAHDANLIRKIEDLLKKEDVGGLDLRVLTPEEAARLSCQRARAGLDTISVTGNVLRDYLTDLFPILELGTSAKMLSIVPLLAGGGLFETGAGGSAPKHVQQFVKEGHLRWDSLGEFLALAVSLESLAERSGNSQARVLARALDAATGRILNEEKSPGRGVGELDNRGSHFYLAQYWAEALAAQTEDVAFGKVFAPLAAALRERGAEILGEIAATQGQPADIGGYYHPRLEQAEAAMFPSRIFRGLLASLA